MENSRIEIKTDGAFSQIFIDGKKLNGVRNYKLEHAAGKAPTLTLDLNAFDLTVDPPQFPPSEKIVVNPDSVSSRIGPLSSATGNAESAGNCCQYCDDEIDHVLQCYILHSVQILSG